MGFSEYKFDALSLWDPQPPEKTAVIHAASSSVKPAPATTSERGVVHGVEANVLAIESRSPRAPQTVEEQVMRYGVAAMMLNLKDSKKATRRCRRRMERAIGSITAAAVTPIAAPHDDRRVPPAAAEWLRNACRFCRRCDGVGEIPAPSP